MGTCSSTEFQDEVILSVRSKSFGEHHLNNNTDIGIYSASFVCSNKYCEDKIKNIEVSFRLKNCISRINLSIDSDNNGDIYEGIYRASDIFKYVRSGTYVYNVNHRKGNSFCCLGSLTICFDEFSGDEMEEIKN